MVATKRSRRLPDDRLWAWTSEVEAHLEVSRQHVLNLIYEGAIRARNVATPSARRPTYQIFVPSVREWERQAEEDAI